MTMHKKKSMMTTFVIIAAFIALILGIFASTYVHRAKTIPVDAFQGTLLESPRKISSFNLQGIDGKPFDNASMKGHWTILFFGFTHCGYLCPTTMAQLAKMYQMLEDKGVQTLPRVVMITLDPLRDSQEQLAKYVRSFNPNFYGARGSDASIKAMTAELGIAYVSVSRTSNTAQPMDDIEHTGTLTLFNPAGQLTAFFTTPHQAQSLVSDYLLLIS